MELKELTDLRKWFDFTEKIKLELRKDSNTSRAEEMADMFANFVQRIHPLSVTSTIVEFFPYLSPNKAIELIEKAISAIESSSGDENTYIQEIICLKLYHCMASIQIKRFEDIESYIFHLKKSSASNENFNLSLLVAALYYEACGDIENSQEYLFEHLKQTNSVHNIEKLIRFSILSRSFFDFAAISSLTEFNQFDNQDLKNLFMNFEEGNISRIDSTTACRLLKVESIDFLREKIYLVNILKMCFKAEQKYVIIEDIMKFLQLDEQSAIGLLITALGLNIVSGWIDSEKRIFYFNSVLPRSLNSEELQKMKFKFVEWRSRVQKVLEAME